MLFDYLQDALIISTCGVRFAIVLMFGSMIRYLYRVSRHYVLFCNFVCPFAMHEIITSFEEHKTLRSIHVLVVVFVRFSLSIVLVFLLLITFVFILRNLLAQCL